MATQQGTTVPATQVIVPLDAPTGTAREHAGGKAAPLAELARAGFPVPAGFVVTSAAFAHFCAANGLGPGSTGEAIAAAPLPPDLVTALHQAARELGDGALAVRSSAVAEDGATASFAGQFATVLDVRGVAALEAAVRACWASARSARVAAYRAGRDQADEPGFAVLVQRMVRADAAGVAFTANPVTGDRDEVAISAVCGLGERLASGEAIPGEWVVRGDEADCRRTAEGALTARQARDVAAHARRIADHFGGPQDVEWAIAGEQLFVLQARPMTALPEPVIWETPLAGGWLRNFRLGEWLPEPVTPLFESWILERIERQFRLDQFETAGFLTPGPPHIVVHGWYFHSPLGTGTPALVLRGLARRPRMGLAAALVQVRPEVSERIFTSGLTRHWREALLPRYRDLVAEGQGGVEHATATELVALIDRLGALVGALFWSLTMVGGSAWKVEGVLARFYQRHLLAAVGRSHQDLLCGLSAATAPPAHAVQSLDWFRPTLGELGVPADEAATARRAALISRREEAEAACRATLASKPRRLRRFASLLALARHYSALREEQVAQITLAWPLLRRTVVRLGGLLRDRGVLDHAEEVFFLTFEELTAGLGFGAHQDSLAAVTTARRREWERQRRLSPPLLIGALPGFMTKLVDDAVAAMRIPGTAGEAALRGMPASPGRATGPVRLIRDAADFHRLQPGDVLVSQIAAPAWTPLFARAAAIVTDSGTIAAHASLVAREYGLPAVVATGDATARLREGQIVVVDGGAGTVEIVGEVRA